jgi:hypothetical protein
MSGNEPAKAFRVKRSEAARRRCFFINGNLA